MHLYLGNIQKVRFYDARITHGVYEPEKSQGYKIAVSATMSQHPWLKEITTKKMAQKGHLVGIALAQKQANDVYQFDSHLRTLFTERLHDFSLLKPDIVKSLMDITNHFSKCHNLGTFEEMFDPSTQYLYACSPIGTPRNNMSQVLSENMQKELDDYKRQQRLKVPSPSSHVDEWKPFSMDRLIPKNKEDQAAENEAKREAQILAAKVRNLKKARAVSIAPSVALFNQKMKRVSKGVLLFV